MVPLPFTRKETSTNRRRSPLPLRLRRNPQGGTVRRSFRRGVTNRESCS